MFHVYNQIGYNFIFYTEIIKFIKEVAKFGGNIQPTIQHHHVCTPHKSIPSTFDPNVSPFIISETQSIIVSSPITVPGPAPVTPSNGFHP